ncbi:unnamed protein product [Brachionus calyciflorus]|uniref:SWIM-type domain-containing protein n=1 Tax=Brachionus calyciflorus TaxID=104777 RepID=A0A814HEK8_9BILA|nr:unnamed protein product [Brachionus calyciflorus]
MTESESTEHILENVIDDTRLDAEDVSPPEQRKRGRGKNYDFFCEFNKFEEIEQQIKNKMIRDSVWFFKSIVPVKQVKSESSGSVFISDNEHQHVENEKKDKILNEVKTKIKYYFELGLTRKDIRNNLVKDGIEPPSYNQMSYILTSIKNEINPSTSKQATLNEFKDWCEQRLVIPDDEDQVFVGKFEFEALPIRKFRVFLTTKRLLQQASKMKHFLSDATYKLTYGNFPILTGGTTDKNKTLHPFGLAVCKTEQDVDFSFYFSSVKETYSRVFNNEIEFTALVADNATAITNGFKQVFNLEKRVQCWAHVIRNIDKHLRSVPKDYQLKLRKDIHDIQSIFREDLFQVAVNLFEAKWKKVNNPGVQNFMSYFKEQWTTEANMGWFEGYLPGLPSTSNALESLHEKFKKEMKGKRLGLLHFLDVCVDIIVKRWSLDRAPTIAIKNPVTANIEIVENKEQKKFNDQAVITDSDMAAADEWNSLNKTIRHLKNKCYYVSSGDKIDITKQECKDYEQALMEKKWVTFDSMIKEIFSINKITVADNWVESICTCSFWQKNYKCSHQIATCAREKKCRFDTIAMDLPIEANRNKGAPKKNLGALMKQPEETQMSKETPRGIESDDEESEESNELIPAPKKRRIDDVKLCTTCNGQLKKLKHCNVYKTGSFRILPKIHKDKFGIRPIINCLNHPTSILCLFIDQFLQPLVKECGTVIKDSQEVLQILNETTFNMVKLFIYSCDFESLYTNIDPDHAIDALCDFLLNTYFNCNDHLDIIGFREILKLIFSNSIFEYEGIHFIQIIGLPMGCKCGPTIANFYLYLLEKTWFNIRRELVFYKRFIDDILIISPVEIDTNE